MDEKQPVTNQRQPFFSPRVVSALADEVAKLVIARLPKRAPAKKKIVLKKDAVGSLFLDTSAIVDGRILEALLLGYGPKVVTLTDGVVLELKHLADSKDEQKKMRAKAALEKLSRIKRERPVTVVTLSEKILKEVKEVDEEIIILAKKYKSRIATGDFNLEKRAHVTGVKVINVNTLSDAFKVRSVPGEVLTLKIIHPGKENHQGVGYLPDGTMVVVEKAAEDMEKELMVKIARVIQTTSGRILFAKKEENKEGSSINSQ